MPNRCGIVHRVSASGRNEHCSKANFEIMFGLRWDFGERVELIDGEFDVVTWVM